MRHLRILLGARLRSLKNRASNRSAGWFAGTAAVLAVLVGGLLALGHAAAPGLLEPPADVVTAMGLDESGELPAGFGALEVAFWLAALASSVLNFRVMELLFRRKDIRSVEQYPVRLYALFVDRLLAALGEAVAATLVIAPFFVPLWWHGGAEAAGTSIALLALGLLTSSAIGFAVQLGAGSTMAGDPPKSGKGETRDIYGGSGQIFLYSPGVALAVSVIIILLAKLALGEVLKAGEFTRAFGVGVGILLVGFVVAVGVSYRYCVASFPRMAARFREADFVGYEISAKHQESSFDRARFGERLLPAAARPVFRTYALQFGRRYMLARYAYGLGWLAGGLALFRLGEAALPMWLRVTLPAIALATVANPWVRLSSPRIRPGYQKLLAVEPAAEWSATIGFALRECVIVAGPYALLVLLAHGTDTSHWINAAGFAALALGAALALNGATALAWRLLGHSRVLELVVPLLVAIGLLAIANVSLLALGATVVVLLGLHFVPGESRQAAPA